MNKTITIALAGFSIIIEEEAYLKLAQYLHALRNSLDADEADEIMYDIEIRVVEILKEKLNEDKREVGNTNDIDHIIHLIGTPEQINDQEENENTNIHYQNRVKKVLFRNPDDKVFSGVASGLATYLGIRSIWVRLLFIIFSFMIVTIVAYIALWILMPVATTTSDKLKMKGQSLNFENIKEHSMNFARKADQQIGGALDGLTPLLQNLGQKITHLVYFIFKILKKTIGVVCFVIALLFIGAVIMGISVAFTKEFSLWSNLNFYVNNNFLLITGFIAAIASLSFFIFLFLILGIKCFNTKKTMPHVGKLLGGLALIGFIGTMICISFPIKISAQQDGPWIENKEEFKLTTNKDTLEIKQIDTLLNADYKKYWGDLESNGDLIFKKDKPRIKLESTDQKTASFEVIKSYRDNGVSNGKISYPIQIQDNKIILKDKYSFSASQKFNLPYVYFKLYVPSHQTVHVINNIHFNNEELQKIDSIFNAQKTLKNIK